jgi:type IV pilus assembly protein PilO
MATNTKQLVYIGVLLAVPVASFFVVFKPQNERIEQSKKDIELKRALLDKLREATAQSADLKRENEEIATSIRALEARLPNDKGIDEVLRDVHNAAESAGLRLPKFRRLDRAILTGVAQEQPIELELAGGFDNLYRFLLKLEQLPRITRITDMKVIRDKDDDGAIRATATLSVYYSGGPEGTKPVQASASNTR